MPLLGLDHKSLKVSQDRVTCEAGEADCSRLEHLYFIKRPPILIWVLVISVYFLLVFSNVFMSLSRLC